ncbi:integrase catalytic domain-containing protein [Trichonephila clavipes]|nr:integrase catalytic domain-containing protein [Trichonephila clavipes]
MYRQILVDPNQRDLQRIMWKTSADAPVKTYKLATVTYGTVSAPFLATRTLETLADEEKAEFLEAADRGGFELHKLVSNSPELLKDLSASSYVFDKEFQDAPVKTLGMLWDPKVDCLTYKVKISDKVNFSKRDVLSEIARLYDPLGLIGPIVTKAKIFIQELWKIKLDWSEQLPPDAMEEWMNFYQKLAKVNNFKIPRCILLPATIRIEIHGFSDASERAYAAVVYINCFNESGQSQTRLLCSKSRVAPLKTLTIPRFINNIKAKESCNKEKYLTADEVKRSTEFLAKIAQLSEFKAEIDALKKGKGVSKTSKLKTLDPFLDENSLLRVGGRLCNADLPFEAKYQIIIPKAIQWKFIPPRSPNFGGLWEAGVKSFKHHLYRTLVNSKITFEEFETIIIQIEGILNSRPLVPLSDNINEYEVLTPGHFIIGRPISAIPEPAISDISDNRLSRWQYTTKCVQTIWKRWKNDYLNHLQQRNKWQFEKNNVAVGCLVLLKENDLPPCKWTMARILEVIYGTDGKVRVVKLKTATGVLTRSISKICILPIENNNIN